LVAIVIVATFVGAWEMLARNAGLGPTLVDNKTLWADNRHQLNKQGQDAIVLLGGSRLHRAIDVETMSERFARPVFQLAVEGSSCLPVLEDIAVDPRVTGTVLISVTPALMFNRKITQLDTGRQARYVANYRRQSLARRLDQKLSLFLQEHLALRTPQAQPAVVIAELIETGQMPAPHYMTLSRDRVPDVDLDLMPQEQSDENMVAVFRRHVTPYSGQEFAPFADYIAALVGLLRQRGANVIFLQLPAAGSVRNYEEETFPRQGLWNALESSVDATFIHYEDYPQLTGFVGRDGSHVESGQMVEFTARLSELLARHMVLDQ